MAMNLSKLNRANIAFGHDIFMAAASFLISLFLRLGGDFIFYSQEMLVLGTVLFTVVSAIVFWSMRMYRGVWRYASVNDLFTITKSASLAILIFFILMFAITRLEALPRSLPFINWFVLIALLGGPRFVYRLFKDRRFEWKLEKEGHVRIPVMLVGADDDAETFIRAMARADTSYRVVGIVADTPNRVGRNIHGIDVLGTIDDIPKVARELERRGDTPQRIILTSNRFDGARVAGFLDAAESLGMTLARLPALTEFRSSTEIGGSTGESIEIRPIDVEDLLGRPQAALDRPAMEALIRGRRVLITGAGGSIGAELVRQIAGLGAGYLTLFDNSEFNLFTIERELAGLQPDLPRSAVIGDVRDRGRVTSLFAAERPELVFHAAALKHVPLVEANCFEGVTTNVLGTRNVADACIANGIKAMVFISTDKAVNPSSVMGASKRIAESYCQALDLAPGDDKGGPSAEGRQGTRFLTVRFGNVLGSTGSVVQIFRAQLAQGGPLTVTHPDMKRYFMTTREAVELVLQASALGLDGGDQAGKIFVLDMGEPVPILELAQQMIRLAGLTPDADIEIEIIGPRPGEKLFEEVFHGSEAVVATAHKDILLAAPRTLDLAAVEAAIEGLMEACENSDEGALFRLIHELVPEYESPQTDHPQASVAG